MASLLETPDRVWQRIKDIEGREMPSLPSLPAFDNSGEQITGMEESSMEEDDSYNPMHSTPAANNHTVIQPPSSTGSTARFARSVASRSTKSSASVSRGPSASVRSSVDRNSSFDISPIPNLPRDSVYDIRPSDQETDDGDDYPQSGEPRVADGEDLDISDALQPISRSNSPGIEPTPRKKSYDYSVSLRSEPKPSPFQEIRNVTLRRPPSRTLARTPSLTSTTPSPNSSTSQSTPGSTRSYRRPQSDSPLPALNIPLPRSATASPTAAFSPRTARPGVRFTGVNNDAGQQEQPSQSDHDMSIDSTAPTEEGHIVQDQREREPTFSSEEGLRSSTQDSEVDSRDRFHMPSPAEVASAFSSPAPSVLFTPTPAFQLRPRARFNLAPQVSTTPQDDPEEDDAGLNETTWRADTQQRASNGIQDQHNDPVTPHTHKRSFLLSVINSTARPRTRFLPTPHPRRAQPDTTIAAANVNNEAENQIPAMPAPNLHTAFAGITPRPRTAIRNIRRLSHPFGQNFVAPSQSASTQSRDTASGSETGTSPYEEQPSYISTTSSQDLTAHVRANTSFDPVIGLGERGHGVGRFNASKLNSYLHGLNRKLQEENEGLVARLREYEEAYGNPEDRSSQPGTTPSSGTSATASYNSRGSRRSSGGGRRVSVGPQLGDVAEDVEGIAQEKAVLEDMVEDLKESLDKLKEEKEKAEKALDDEKNERARDKERWRERMGEVERGVENIVRDLENKQHEAEQKAREAEEDKLHTVRDAERRLAEVVVERDVLQERIEQAENALQSGKDLGAELNAANERVGKIMSELKNAEIEIKQLEDDAHRSKHRIAALEDELNEEKQHNSDLQEELDITVDKFSQAVRRVEDLDKEVKSSQQELSNSKEYIGQLEHDADIAAERIRALEQEVTTVREELEETQHELQEEFETAQHLEEENKKSAELARQLEEALEAAESRMLQDQEQLIALRDKFASLERELDKSKSYHASDASQAPPDPELQRQIEDLEAELAEAHKEIARLQTALNQSPARKAIEKAKDAKIEMLEKEKEDLQERLRSLKTQSLSFHTPNRVTNVSGISPLHRQTLSAKSPKTPGGPLRDLSWLQSTMHDATAAPLVAEIERLQHELDRANEDIDDKLDRLEDAGVGMITLSQQLEDSKVKVSMLEVEITCVTRREERRLKRLERLRCQKCHIKVDLTAIMEVSGDESSYMEEPTMGPAEPSTPPTKTSEKLRADLHAVNTHLNTMRRQWEEERRQLLGKNAALQDAASRLNAEVRNAKSQIERYAKNEREVERNKDDIQQELAEAKRTVEELEEELKEERSRLRAVMAEQTEAERQREQITFQLRRTESDMTEIKEHLHKIKQENHELEAELRNNANLDQKARLLERKVAENAATIEQLRQERSLLVSDHKALQKRYAEASKHVNKLRDQYSAGQTSHDNRRHELDLQVLEIEDLRRTLSQREDDLQRAEEAKKRMADEKHDVARTVAALEADLRRVKRDAEAFGRDLKLLRSQKDQLEADRQEQITKAERAQKQSQAQIRLLREEIYAQKEKVRTEVDKWKNHACVGEEQLQTLKLQHNNECKGLVVQIRYLKAKFTRESTLRSDLGYQKRYLLALLSRSERSEQKILAAIARIGFLPVDPPKPRRVPKKTLKTVALSLLFIRRIERASEAWRQHSASKEAIAAALQEVRRRRVAGDEAASGPAITNRKGKERVPP